MTRRVFLTFSLLVLVVGCSREPSASANAANPPKHEHNPPHGGTPVSLGNEDYHIEWVRDADSGTLRAFVFDGEFENFVRCTQPSIEVDALVNGATQRLVLRAVPNPATGETVGDTAEFETEAPWLKTTDHFAATLKSITIRGTTFADIAFDFPKGNDPN